MLALLQEVVERTATENQFHGTAKLRRLRQQHKAALAAKEVAPLGWWRIHYELGQAFLNQGESERANEHLEQAYSFLPQVDFAAAASKSARTPNQENVYYHATKIRTLEIFWPASNTTQTFHDVEVDRGIRVIEGEDALQPLALPSFELAG